MKRIIHILLLLLTAVGASAQEMSELDSLYADFIGLEVRDMYDSAYAVLKHCHEIDPEAAELNYQMALYKRMFARTDTTAVEEEVMAEVIAQLKKAYEAEPDNKKYARTLLNACAQTGDTLMIQPLLERLIELDKNETQYLTILMRLYDGKGEYEKELGLLDRLETVYGKTTETELTRAEILKKLYGDKKALKYVKGLMKKSPEQGEYHLYLAQYYAEKEEYKQALPFYDKALALNPNDASTRYYYISCLEQMGETEKARGQKMEIVNDPKAVSELKVQIVRDLLEEFETEENGTERMMQMFRTALEQPQENGDMTELYVGYMGLQKWTADSIVTALEDVLHKQPCNELAYLYLLEHYGTKDKKDNVIDICRRSREAGHNRLDFYYWEAVYNYQLDRKDECMRLCKEAVAQRQFANNPKMYADCYGMIGSLYHDMDSIQQTYEAYEECLKWNPDDTGTLNNYAYYLSIDGKDLEKAERMSRRTVEAEPDNGTYLDTYAWVLFKMERYDEAATYINKALADLGETSAEIYDHAGDIYQCLNEPEAAIAYWELARDNGKQEGKDTEHIEQKIENLAKSLAKTTKERKKK